MWGINTNAFIFSVIVILILFVISRIYIDYESTLLNKYNVPFDKVKWSTGDIIIFKWWFMESSFRLFSKFSHCGMVINNNGELSLLETHPDEFEKGINFKNSGTHLYKLKDRLEEYNGDIYYLNIKEPINTNLLLDNYNNKYRNIPFDNDFRNAAILSTFNIRFETKDLYCSRLLGHILNDLQITKDFNADTPCSFLKLDCYDQESFIKVVI